MNERHLIDTVANHDQAKAELDDWAKTLGGFRRALSQEGFSGDQATRLCAVWFGDQLFEMPSAPDEIDPLGSE
jgi:hypothetical protein